MFSFQLWLSKAYSISLHIFIFFWNINHIILVFITIQFSISIRIAVSVKATLPFVFVSFQSFTSTYSTRIPHCRCIPISCVRTHSLFLLIIISISQFYFSRNVKRAVVLANVWCSVNIIIIFFSDSFFLENKKFTFFTYVVTSFKVV